MFFAVVSNPLLSVTSYIYIIDVRRKWKENRCRGFVFSVYIGTIFSDDSKLVFYPSYCNLDACDYIIS